MDVTSPSTYDKETAVSFSTTRDQYEHLATQILETLPQWRKLGGIQSGAVYK
jgi:hypothetical protein